MWHSWKTAGIITLFAGAMLGCGSATSGTGGALAPEDLDLSGAWTLNLQESDNPAEMTEQVGMTGGRTGGGRPSGGGGRPSGGRGGRGGMDGGAPNQGDQQRIMQTRRIATQPPRRLVLEQVDSTITIRNGVGRTLMLRTNWKKVEQEIENDGRVEIKARWRGRDLQIERQVHRGGKVIQKYSLLSSGDRLLVETRLEVGRAAQPRVFHYVYDSAPRSQ
jgi:hypothetical protein